MFPSRLFALTALAVAMAACGPAGQQTAAPPTPPPTGQQSPLPTDQATEQPIPTGRLTIYSGRSEQLIGPLVAQFGDDTGIEVNVRYGDTAELAVLLLEEGANSPADVFFAQDAGGLGAVAQAGMFAELPDELISQVPAGLRSSRDEWLGISGRARVIAYDAEELAEADLPRSIDELTDERWRGRIGWAPTNGSFQSFVTALRLLRGDDGARAWLSAMLANQPQRYEGNTPIVQAIADGEIELGLVNHYYALRQRAEQGADFAVRNHFLPGADPGSLINVAGVGVLATTRNEQAARAFVEYLLTPESQRYFAEQTYEYPIVDGVAGPADVPPLADLAHPDLDLSDLSDLQGTLDLLHEVGVLP